jgi:methionine-gamma-lyase
MKTTECASNLMDLLQNEQQFGFIAVSLGYFDTLMSCPGASTSSEMSEDAQTIAGISPGLVRFSIGLTGSIEERWNQMKTAIEQC